MNGGPVPDETLQKSRRSHPEAGGVAKPALGMRNEVGFRGVDHENLNRSLPRLTGVLCPVAAQGVAGKVDFNRQQPSKKQKKILATMSDQRAANYPKVSMQMAVRGWNDEGAEDLEVHRETSKYIQIAWRLSSTGSLFAARR